MRSRGTIIAAILVVGAPSVPHHVGDVLPIGIPLVCASQTPASSDPRVAVIVRGIGGDPTFERQFASWTERLYEILRERWKFPQENILVFTPDGSGPFVRVARATASVLREEFDRMRARLSEESTVFILLIGHGSFDGERATFHLVGPDLSAEDFGALLRGMRARHIVFVNTASASGAFLPAIGRAGAIAIAATRSGRQQQATVFAHYFIEALADERADADKDGHLSVWEAFAWAAQRTAEHYAEQGLLATEHPLLEDDGDGVGQDVKADAGGRARRVYWDRAAEEGEEDPELRALLRARQELLEKIEALKARRSEMAPHEYERELERWLVELATVSERIAARRKKP